MARMIRSRIGQCKISNGSKMPGVVFAPGIFMKWMGVEYLSVGKIRERFAFYKKRIKEGWLKDFILQTKWIYAYARRYWLQMVFYTALGMVGTVVSLGLSLVSRNLVDIITGHQTGILLQNFCLMIGLNLGNAFVSMISNYASNWISMKVDAEIKSEIFEKILTTDWESLTNYHTGDLLTRWNSDASQISSGVLGFIPNAIVYVFKFISAFAMVIYYDWTFAIFAFLGMPVSLLLSRTLMRRMVNNNKRSAAMGAKMSGFNQETFSNIQTIKAFGLIRLYVQHLKQLQQDYIHMKLDFQKMSVWTSLLMTTVGLIVSYASYGWGIYRVWGGFISYGTMTMFLALSGTLTTTLSNLTSLVPTAIALATSAGRLMDIVEMPQEDFKSEPQARQFMETWRGEGISLEMDHVSYTYATGTEVFHAASLYAMPHEIVALVGPSGEGKTTMLRMMLALVPVREGRAMLYAGHVPQESWSELAADSYTGTKDTWQDLQGYDLSDADGNGNLPVEEKIAETLALSPGARQVFSYVPQGNTMFSGTIVENMRNVKEDATDEEIIAALQLACAWEFVEKLPDGIQSMVGERGGGFSEGQAQRLSIARALLRKSPILLLDEATSALDVATERRVLRNIMRDDYPRTVIVTTHRPSVLNICTRVYEIRDKQCVVLDEDEIDEKIRNF